VAVYSIEQIRRAAYNIRQAIKSMDTADTTHIYAMYLLDVDRDDKEYVLDTHDADGHKGIPPIRILIVCNRTMWKEGWLMFGIFHIETITSDFLNGVKDMWRSQELVFDEEDEIERTTAKTGGFPRY